MAELPSWQEGNTSAIEFFEVRLGYALSLEAEAEAEAPATQSDDEVFALSEAGLWPLIWVFPES
eukprot:CAMPEP_0206489940 /NCGR_PEP_ID=MMETSP0324_2-20121206/43655_1 /ASSEMBLY_ACC=CAM_ASM_000836 /TAXON_ID=2866 /ORGANISM="Crypthecodinium cohnii, Strain Seligo" /LENGTH=63 /DNA_ID=CAMNT_0053969947 /DNA_START=19 /DNA_END=210 /DNA_ORIENTATION=+